MKSNQKRIGALIWKSPRIARRCARPTAARTRAQIIGVADERRNEAIPRVDRLRLSCAVAAAPTRTAGPT